MGGRQLRLYASAACLLAASTGAQMTASGPSASTYADHMPSFAAAGATAALVHLKWGEDYGAAKVLTAFGLGGVAGLMVLFLGLGLAGGYGWAAWMGRDPIPLLLPLVGGVCWQGILLSVQRAAPQITAAAVAAVRRLIQGVGR